MAGSPTQPANRHPIHYGFCPGVPKAFDDASRIRGCGRQSARDRQRQLKELKACRELDRTTYEVPVGPMVSGVGGNGGPSLGKRGRMPYEFSLNFGPGIHVCDEPDPMQHVRAEQSRQLRAEAEAQQQLDEGRFVAQQRVDAAVFMLPRTPPGVGRGPRASVSPLRRSHA